MAYDGSEGEARRKLALIEAVIEQQLPPDSGITSEQAYFRIIEIVEIGQDRP